MPIFYQRKHNADSFVERFNLLAYHVDAALQGDELHSIDRIVEALPVPINISPNLLREEFFSGWPNYPDLLLWYISSWDYSEIGFDGVFYNSQQTIVPPYALLSGGCDYTGWGCQSGASIVFADTDADLVRWAMGDDQRRQWGIELSDDN